MQSLTRNNHITSNHLPLLLFTTSKDIFIRIFSIAALFSYSNVSIAVYTRTTSLCNLASKIQGSRARSDAYEQTRRIFTLLSAQKIERAAKSATLPYAFYIFEVLMSPLRFGRCKTDIHRMSVLHPICGMVHPHLSYTPYKSVPTAPLS